MTIPHHTVGRGPHTVFCLHGWFGSAAGWGSLPDYLDGERFTYVFTDSRGYGERIGEAGEYTLDEVAGDVLALADELGVDQFSLVGHSMGGAGVLRVLALAPDRVRKIVALTPVGASPTPFDEDGRSLFWGAVDSRDMRMGIIDFTTGNRLTSTWVASVADWSLEHSTREAFHGALEAWAHPDFLNEIAGNQTPMLVIPGEHDPALGEAAVRETWEPHFPNCQIHVMANAGHYPMFETPVQLATVIERFLAD